MTRTRIRILIVQSGVNITDRRGEKEREEKGREGGSQVFYLFNDPLLGLVSPDPDVGGEGEKQSGGIAS